MPASPRSTTCRRWRAAASSAARAGTGHRGPDGGGARDGVGHPSTAGADDDRETESTMSDPTNPRGNLPDPQSAGAAGNEPREADTALPEQARPRSPEGTPADTSAIPAPAGEPLASSAPS